MSEVVVRDAGEKHRYEAVVEGQVVGFSTYRLGDGVITFLHTEVESEWEGQGVGSTLVRQSLDQVRADGELTVVARCPFYRDWIDRHPDYQDLLD